MMKQLKSTARAWLNNQKLEHAMRAIAHLGVGEMPNRALLTELLAGWSNDGFAARIEYIEEVAKQTITGSGPILECGSGATTILMGLLAAKQQREVWSLEHSDEWFEKVKLTVERSHLNSSHVC